MAPQIPGVNTASLRPLFVTPIHVGAQGGCMEPISGDKGLGVGSTLDRPLFYHRAIFYMTVDAA